MVIGDQASGEFWDRFVAEVPRLDVLIDDGGHTPEMQHATMERALPLLAPGGVYIIEDIHGAQNGFAREVFERFIDGFDGLNAGVPGHTWLRKRGHARDRKLEHKWRVDARGSKQEVIHHDRLSSSQRSLFAITYYPYAIVIEKLYRNRTELRAGVRGDRWLPDEFDHRLRKKSSRPPL